MGHSCGPAVLLRRALTQCGLSCCAGQHDAQQFRSPILFELPGVGEEAVRKLYSIQEELGRGNFGKVYACSRLGQSDAREVSICVKVAPLRGDHSARVAKLCESDRRDILVRCFDLDHPNLVRHHRFISTEDALYVVMDRCHGPDLEDHLETCGGFLPVDRVRLLGRQILGALSAVHAMGIMHRDVKTENLRFHDADCQTLKLLDFGFAKPGTADAGLHTVTGTLLYVAPEVFDSVYGNLCDVWSVGVVLYLLFSGGIPFDTSDVSMMRSMHKDPVLTGDSMFRGERWKYVPRGGRALVRGLLTVDVARRLTAEAAAVDEWLLDDSGTWENLPPTPSNSMRNRSTSSLVELKRAHFFVWNLDNADDATDGALSVSLSDEGADHDDAF